MRSASHITIATMISIEAISTGERKLVSMRFSSSAPASPAGIVAAIMYHSNRRSLRSSSGERLRCESLVSEKRTTFPPNAALSIWSQVRQKYTRIASKVPPCRATSNVSPGSLQFARPSLVTSHGASARCAVLEIGRNSVNP